MYSPQNSKKGKDSNEGKCAVNWLHICHRRHKLISHELLISVRDKAFTLNSYLVDILGKPHPK